MFVQLAEVKSFISQEHTQLRLRLYEVIKQELKMEKISKETQEKIQQLQIFEQNLQNLLLQKQAFQFESNETENALEEVRKTKEDIYKLIGQVMLKASKQDIEKELSQKKDILNLRIKTIERQETRLKEETEKLREDVLKKLK